MPEREPKNRSLQSEEISKSRKDKSNHGWTEKVSLIISNVTTKVEDPRFWTKVRTSNSHHITI
jgi:hypothetical protein